MWSVFLFFFFLFFCYNGGLENMHFHTHATQPAELLLGAIFYSSFLNIFCLWWSFGFAASSREKWCRISFSCSCNLLRVWASEHDCQQGNIFVAFYVHLSYISITSHFYNSVIIWVEIGCYVSKHPNLKQPPVLRKCLRHFPYISIPNELGRNGSCNNYMLFTS